MILGQIFFFLNTIIFVFEIFFYIFFNFFSLEIFLNRHVGGQFLELRKTFKIGMSEGSSLYLIFFLQNRHV